MRAPTESGSWTWTLDDVPGPGPEFVLATAARMSAVLAKRDLLELRSLEWDWSHAGGRGLAGRSRLGVSASGIAHPAWADRLRFCHPQPRIHAHNASRLAAAPRKIEHVLGVEAEPARRRTADAPTVTA